MVGISRDSNTITIANFYENYTLGKYNFNPPYQRKSVWTEEKESFFIDSILKNFPVPPVFLHLHIDDDTGQTKYDVIDGKQRLQSIIKFIENKIPVSNEQDDLGLSDESLSGSFFRDLDKPNLTEYKKRFWRYDIPIEYIDATAQEIVENIFDRLNRNGEKLNGQELRNAKYHGSHLIKVVDQMVASKFWRNLLAESVDLPRMEDYEFISELMFFVIEGSPLDARPRIIDDLYEKYANQENVVSDALERFKKVTDFLESMEIEYDLYRIKGVSHLYGLVCLAAECMDRGLDPKEVCKKIMPLFVDLRSDEIRTDLAISYKRTMTSNTKSKGQRVKRFNILKEYCGL